MEARWDQPRPDTGGESQADDRLVELCHDLRQYVAAGLLLTDRMRGDEDLPEPVRRRLSQANDQFRAVADLMSAELADGSRADAWVEVAGLVERCAESARLATGTQIVLEVHARPRLAGDAVLLSRAVGNVLENACRASGPAGLVVVTLDERDGCVWVAVRDDGPGFGRIPDGRGRGLLIARTAVVQHQGELAIDDAPGHGAVVSIRLPLVHTPAVRG